ncbi:MAG: cyclodeaminase/cyclohydrolase family protein [bacterium]|nr:cyclodeaminase/cyclohydrolase family protein [bacterium]
MESVDTYLTQLASEWPTPGGGSAATLVGAAGAALVAMVARINSANPKYAPLAPLAHELVAAADALRENLVAARVRDEAAFDRVVAATAMPKASDEEKRVRREALEIALLHAAAEPLLAAQDALAVMRLAARSLEIPNKNLVSDIGCAAEFAAAALAACAYNVRINHRYMNDAEAIAAQANALARYERECNALLASVRRSIAELLGS